ncbi:MAG: hypothetical protein IPM82_06445 [Saprospiraceae bacterium]|nr:hypothetical protein [Saprospiraceae bacterium]
MAGANANIVEYYLNLLSGLSAEVKLDLISKLSASLKMDFGKKKPDKVEKKSILDFAGCWESDKTAEELIEEIRSARTFNRVIEPL